MLCDDLMFNTVLDSNGDEVFTDELLWARSSIETNN